MSLEYVYPTKNTIQKINASLSPKTKLKYEDYLTIYEVVPVLTKGSEALQVFDSESFRIDEVE